MKGGHTEQAGQDAAEVAQEGGVRGNDGDEKQFRPINVPRRHRNHAHDPATREYIQGGPKSKRLADMSDPLASSFAMTFIANKTPENPMPQEFIVLPRQ